MGLSDHLILLRYLYAGQEATVRTDSFQIAKGVHQGCVLSPCLFNLEAEYIIWHATLDESQAGLKIAGRNINNLNGHEFGQTPGDGEACCRPQGHKESDMT